MFVVILLALVTVIIAQKPHPCQSPEQFEGRFSAFDGKLKLFVHGTFAYDDRLRRTRQREEFDIGKETDFYDKLYLYNEGKEYFLNLRTRQCNVTGLTRPWMPFGVPQDARFRGTVDLGAAGIPDEHVVMNLFDGNMGGHPYFQTVTATDCLPISSTFFSNQTGSMHRNFYDISIGIADPMAFIPPKECQT